MPCPALRCAVSSASYMLHLFAAGHANDAHTKSATQRLAGSMSQVPTQLGGQHPRFAGSPLTPCADDNVARSVVGLHRHTPPDSRARAMSAKESMPTRRRSAARSALGILVRLPGLSSRGSSSPPRAPAARRPHSLAQAPRMRCQLMRTRAVCTQELRHTAARHTGMLTAVLSCTGCAPPRHTDVPVPAMPVATSRMVRASFAMKEHQSWQYRWRMGSGSTIYRPWSRKTSWGSTYPPQPPSTRYHQPAAAVSRVYAPHLLTGTPAKAQAARRPASPAVNMTCDTLLRSVHCSALHGSISVERDVRWRPGWGLTRTLPECGSECTKPAQNAMSANAWRRAAANAHVDTLCSALLNVSGTQVATLGTVAGHLKTGRERASSSSRETSRGRMRISAHTWRTRASNLHTFKQQSIGQQTAGTCTRMGRLCLQEQYLAGRQCR